MSGADLISMIGVKFYYEVRKGFLNTITVKAVDGVSLSIRKGETVAVVGESGSGKTTLGKGSLLLLKPVAGQILFDGEEISQMQPDGIKEFRKKSQIIFQDPYSSIDPFMNIYHVLEEPLAVHKIGNRDERNDRIYRALEEVRMHPVEEFVGKFPHMLSGGQRQRVVVARALMLEPRYIVADEPVSMIDASSRIEILRLLKELQRKHQLSFLYITHDIATAKYFSDRVAVMYLGKVVELGPTREVISNPLHPYTQALIQAVPDPDPRNREILRQTVTGEPPSSITPPPACKFHPRCSFAMSICSEREPALVEVKKGHFVSCYLHHQVQEKPMAPLAS